MSQTKVQTSGIESNAITSDIISDGSVTPAKLSTGAPTWNTAGTLTTTSATVVPQDSYIKLGDAYVSSGNITSGPQANSRYAHFGSNIYYNGSNWVSDGRGPGGVYQVYTTPSGVVSHNWYKHNGATGGGEGFTFLMGLDNDANFRIAGSFIDARAGSGVFNNLNLRGENVSLCNTSGVARLSLFSANNRIYLAGSASRGATGYPITTSNDSIASCLRGPGFIEWQSDAGAIGTSYFLSDESKKNNIASSTFNSSELINKIKFIEFDWKPESGKTGHVDAGLSAQNLQSIDERLVNVLSDDTLMVNEPTLITHIAKALQEALSEIETLKTRISALESK